MRRRRPTRWRPIDAQRRARRRSARRGCAASTARSSISTSSPSRTACSRTSDETIDVLRALAAAGRRRRRSPRRSASTPTTRRAQLRDHVQVCFDCCHFAVEYEDPPRRSSGCSGAGIRVGRVQLSSALDVALSRRRGASATRVADRLRPFADSTYLHQVIERHGGALRHFPDLDDALRRRGAEHAATRVAHPLPRAALHRATTTASARRRTTSRR